MRFIKWALFLGVLGGIPSYAAEPHAAFALKDGWVEFVLQQDGRPVANAVIQVIDDRGQNFAEGETVEGGQAEFPLPRGSSFIVEIKTDNRTADPIRLFKTDQGIEPARVLLSYGLRPCCRFLGKREVTPTATSTAPVEDSSGQLWLAALGGLVTLTGLYLVVKRMALASGER